MKIYIKMNFVSQPINEELSLRFQSYQSVISFDHYISPFACNVDILNRICMEFLSFKEYVMFLLTCRYTYCVLRHTDMINLMKIVHDRQTIISQYELLMERPQKSLFKFPENIQDDVDKLIFLKAEQKRILQRVDNCSYPMIEEIKNDIDTTDEILQNFVPELSSYIVEHPSLYSDIPKVNSCSKFCNIILQN